MAKERDENLDQDFLKVINKKRLAILEELNFFDQHVLREHEEACHDAVAFIGIHALDPDKSEGMVGTQEDFQTHLYHLSKLAKTCRALADLNRSCNAAS